MNSPEVWRKDFLEPAIAALAKMKVAKFVGEVADASRFESEYNGYMDKLAHMDDNAAKALENEVANAANDLFEANRAKLMAIKHADEPISLSHGTKWKDHKYIRIENGRYIYPDDEAIKNSKEKKYVALRKEAYKKSNDANIIDAMAPVAGRNSSENDIAAAITRSQASGMRRTADLLEAQMKEQKRREQESKNESEIEDKVSVLKDSLSGRSPLSQKDKESYSDLENKVRNKCKEFYSEFGNADVKVYKDSLGRVSFVEVWTDEKDGKSSSETFYMDWEQKVKHSFDSFLAHALDAKVSF